MTLATVSFVGDSSLLPRCAEAARAAGVSIVGVLTRDPRVADWAKSAKIPLWIKGDPGFSWSALEADYLFSAANLDMLPGEALAAARIAALNFHDGPLPAYAGLNAAAWALIHGETVHGVVWHEMTATPDAGRIAAARAVAIDAEDDALTLNAKCYEAGLAAFDAVLADIAAGGLRLTPQAGARAYFSRAKRPPLGGLIDPAASADAIVRLVRGLHAGPYDSPLGFAKLVVDGELFLVGSAVRQDVAPGAAPGTVLAADSDGVTLATADGAVRLGVLQRCDGATVRVADEPALRPGAVAARLTPEACAALDTHVRAAAKVEAAQRACLRAAVAVDLPYGPGGGSQRIVIGGIPDPNVRIAAVLVWAAHITDAASISACYATAADAAPGPTFAPGRPLTLSCPGDATGAALVAAVRDARAALDALGPFPADLRLRDAPADRASVDPLRLPLSISLDGAAPPSATAALHAEIDAATDVLILHVGIADHDAAAAIGAQIAAMADALANAPDRPLRAIALEDAAQSAALRGPAIAVAFQSVADAVIAQAQRTPDACALRSRWESVDYATLHARIDAIAAALAAQGVKRGDIVGVCLERSADLVATLLGVMRAGAAYLPLDPSYPPERTRNMVADSGAGLVVMSARTQRDHVFANARIAAIETLRETQNGPWRAPHVDADDLAYVIYTSGSTGQPKGVMITHRAAANFFAGMDAHIPHGPGDVWLAVTGPSFDISILELFWTLSRGVTVALHAAVAPAQAARAPRFSLFYFAAAAPDAADPYRLLFEGAKFADANGFEAVWTPERHFHAFGAPYPNPAVTAAALSAMTRRVQLRAGSCVLPLHSPIRVAEEWSVVDVMSNGRVGLAFASGWQPHDFVLAPQDFRNRKAVMLSRMEEVRALWRGDAVRFPDADGALIDTRTLPRPVQRELPIWLTAAKSPETFEEAGRRGVNVLTHMLGMSLAEVGENVRRYRQAWREAGHAGRGRVTLMAHSFVGDSDEAVREIVRAPMKRYLSNAFDLVRDASFSFPTIVEKARATGKSAAEILKDEPMTPEELDALLDHAFDRYFQTSGLFGAHDTCLAMTQAIADIDVDEIACLIDFGVAAETVLAHLPNLKAVMDAASAVVTVKADVSVADDLEHCGATHFQCTPSMAAMVVSQPHAHAALSRLKTMMVGGEALPQALADEIKALLPQGARLLNMYGPTETTIWSSVADVTHARVHLGDPIANTTLRVAGADGRARPAYAPGELWIAGEGLARGYWRRDDLTAERFVTLDGVRHYRTGDLVRRDGAGRLDFLGRIDHQVKLRGHRIELGEIEATLSACEGVAHAVVAARADAPGDVRLVGYYTVKPGAVVDERAVRAALAATLPDIMRPSALVRLQSWPMTPNGKIDRKALPAPNAAVIDLEIAPSEGLEGAIARIWRECLGLERIGASQNFFDLGGHSLSAVQVQRRIRAELGLEMAITDMFRFSTVRDLARHLDGAHEAAASAALRGADRAKARLAARTRSASTE
ncbi:MAG: LLM class flavin-dependent oxidoreductase [Hyphomonadaceae bacterium]|nr:LLM class flavin-dependent oxidoreductase [Hyphomonadaceae bacterium]